MPAIIAEPGMPVWTDLATNDLRRAMDFYGAVLGWEFEEKTEHFAMAKRDGLPVAGLAQIPEGDNSMWGLSLYTPDVKDAHDKSVRCGASSVLEPHDLENDAAMAVILDPAGAAIALKNPEGEQALIAAGEPGTPVWFELLVAKNWAETLNFYHELAGWDIKMASDNDDFRYATGDLNGAALAGLWDTSGLEDSASMWSLYMGVASVDQATQKAKDHGGSVVRQPWNSDFGRMSTILDPTGALLNLCEIAEYDPAAEDQHEPDLFAD